MQHQTREKRTVEDRKVIIFMPIHCSCIACFWAILYYLFLFQTFNDAELCQRKYFIDSKSRWMKPVSLYFCRCMTVKNSRMILHVRKWHFAPWSAPAASRLSAARGTTMIANETFRCVMYGIMSVTLQSVVWQIFAQLTRTVWQSHVGWGRHDNTCPRSFYCLALLFCDPSTGNSKHRVRFFFSFSSSIAVRGGLLSSGRVRHASTCSRPADLCCWWLAIGCQRR